MKKPFIIKDRIKSFYYAFNGLKYAVANEHNLRIQLVSAILVILLSVLVGLNFIEWCMIIICIGMVISAELMNSAIEHLVNHISPGQNLVAGKIKDLAAGAVLFTAFISFVIALIIFGSKMWRFYCEFR